MLNTLVLVKKPNMETLQINNVAQLDLCNMAELGDEVSDSDWNFVSILFEENSEKKKLVIKLEDIWQFSLVRNKE